MVNNSININKTSNIEHKKNLT